MINVTEEYKEKIYDDSTKTYCTVSYGSIDVTARSLAEASASSSKSWTSPDNTLDGEIQTQKYATGEQNEWILDGSVELFPSDPTTKEWGWWSNNISKADGTFDSNPLITYEWNENHTSVGVTLYTLNPIFEAIIRWYDGDNTLLDTYTLTNDDMSKTEYVVENGVVNYRKIEIEFVEVLPYHYVKMEDITFGVGYVWQDEISNIEIDESIDHKTQELSSNQAVITLNNINNAFNKYNPNNKLKYLQEGQRIKIENIAQLGNSEEAVSLGVFYLTSWNNPTEYTTQLVANDLIYKLSNREYTHSRMYTNAKASVILNDLFTQFNLIYDGMLQYDVDSNVADVELTGYIPIVDYRTALQQICFALGAVAYCNRDGKIVIKRLGTQETVETIGYDKKSYAGDNEEDKYSSVSIKEYTYEVGTDTEKIFEGTLTGDNTITFDTPYSNITITGTYTSFTAYPNCVDIVGASGNIVINGKPYKIYEKNVVATIEDTTVGITKQEMSVDSVYLIGNDTTANHVANWLLGELQKYITNEFKWLGNPSIELGDKVSVQVSEDLYRDALVQKNKFSFNGALIETSEVVM